MTRVLLVLFGLATLAAPPAGYTDGPVIALGLLTVAAAVVHAADLVAARLALWTDDEPVRDLDPSAVPYVPAAICSTLEATLRDLDVYEEQHGQHEDGWTCLAPARDRVRRALDTLP